MRGYAVVDDRAVVGAGGADIYEPACVVGGHRPCYFACDFLGIPDSHIPGAVGVVPYMARSSWISGRPIPSGLQGYRGRHCRVRLGFYLHSFILFLANSTVEILEVHRAVESLRCPHRW